MRSNAIIRVCAILFGLSSPYLLAQSPAPALQTGTVTGIVRSTAGRVVSGVRVSAIPASAIEEISQAGATSAMTDDTGRYRIEKLPVGRYYIAAGSLDMPTFYPATLDRARAATVSVSSTNPDIDFNIVMQGSDPASLLRLRSEGRRIEVAPFGPKKTPVVPNAVNPIVPNGPFSVQPNVRVLDRVGELRDRLTGSAWWTNKALVARLGITEDQKKKIETIFEQHRSALMQTKADLEKEESALSRMLEAEPLESTKTISAQIDRVIQARGEMERNNSGMTLEMRQALSRAQWVQLQAEAPQPFTVLVQPAVRFQQAAPKVRPAPVTPAK
jgi:hypothetical protein